MNDRADRVDRWAQRVTALAAAFETIARTRMAGLPVLNPALQVEAVGFECAPTLDDGSAAGTGILVTPWFMNLVRLPLWHQDVHDHIARTERHSLGGEPFDFIGAHEPAIGAFAACSLFSPMFAFSDQATARATAQAVLATLRSTRPGVDDAAPQARPARRAFLFGRSSARAATP